MTVPDQRDKQGRRRQTGGTTNIEERQGKEGRDAERKRIRFCSKRSRNPLSNAHTSAVIDTRQ